MQRNHQHDQFNSTTQVHDRVKTERIKISEMTQPINQLRYMIE